MSAREPLGAVGRFADAVTGRLVDAVPPEVLISHLDLDAILDQIDINHLLDRVDVNRLLDRIDVSRLLDRVDVEALLSDVELEALVRRAGIPAIVAETTGNLAGGTLDTVRRQLVGIDTLVSRIFDRILRGRGTPIAGPEALLPPDDPIAGKRLQMTGRYAGPASRLTAILIDLGLGLATYAAAGAVVSWLLRTLISRDIPSLPGWAATMLLFGWLGTYMLFGAIISGRTVGKAIVGVRIVQAGGRPLGAGSAVVRVIAFPFSLAFFGIGVAWMLFDRRRRTFHDIVAKTAVVYDWGDRPAELPTPLSSFLNRHQVPQPAPGSTTAVPPSAA